MAHKYAGTLAKIVTHRFDRRRARFVCRVAEGQAAEDLPELLEEGEVRAGRRGHRPSEWDWN